ncbi:MAG: hypothetical protein Q8P36_01950 [bacterium]|nr:hypothetical protein [bacterium]
MKKEISTLDALRAFYLADELLKSIIRTSKKDEGKLRRKLKQAVRKVEKMPVKKLLTYATKQWGPRFDNYFNSSWEIKEVPLAECGVWPRMGGLPDAATRGSVVDTAEYLRQRLVRKEKMSPQLRRALQLEKLGNFAEVITEYIPITVFTGGVIRHNMLSTEVQRAHYVRCRYDIDDGNHRSVILALHGRKKILALVGTRTCKSDLLYF